MESQLPSQGDLAVERWTAEAIADEQERMAKFVGKSVVQPEVGDAS